MGLRIATNVPSLVAQRNIEANSKEVVRSISRLSTGQRIMSAADDAAGLSISKKLDAEISGLQQAQRNANDGVSFVQTAEGSLNEISNILVRIRELSVQSASDTVGDEERSFIHREYENLKAEIDRVANVTNFNGRALLNGTGAELTFQVGPHATENDVIRYKPEETNATVQALGIGGTGIMSKDDALESLDHIDQAISKVNSYRAGLGGMQTRLHTASNTISVHVENMAEARSRIADTDFADEAANLARRNIMQSAGIAVLAQANSNASNVLKLL